MTEHQMQLDELSGRNLSAKEMFAQSFAYWSLVAMVGAAMLVMTLSKLWRGCQRDGRMAVSKSVHPSITRAGQSAIAERLPSPTNAPTPEP